MSQKKITFLVSGSGGTLKFLFKAIDILHLSEEFEINRVIADRECESIEFAKKVGLENLVLDYNQHNKIELYNQIALNNKADIIITNMHKILDDAIVAIPGIKFINLHYSLLPSFGGIIGMKTITEAKIRNVKFIGATAHFVSEKVDQGPIICQSAFPVNWDISTVYEIEQIVFESACLCLLNTLYSFNYQLYDNYKGVSYNPPLSFDPAIFNEKFWNKIRNT